MKKTSELMQDMGIAKDAKRNQMIEKIFNPKIPERLTVIPTRKQLIHLNYTKQLAHVIGGEVGTFIFELWEGEIDHSYSLKGIGLEKYTNILEQQNAGDITVRNETIPQQLQEKQGFWARFRGKPNE